MTDATATPATDAPALDLSSIAELSPLEQIAAVNAQLKALKANAGAEMANDAKAKFEPLHEQFLAAFAAVVDASNPETAAQALKWIGDNIGDYRKMGRVYHKHVFGVVAPRKPRTPKSDTEAQTEPVAQNAKKGAKAAA